MAKGLTKRQEIFVAEYLKDLNATRAAIAAGYSKTRASVAGAELVRNRKVAEVIAKKTEKRVGKLEITADKVLQELAKLAFFDPRKLFDENGNPKHITDLDDDTAAAVAGLEVYEEFDGHGEDREQVGITKKIKIADKGQNLERLGRYFKLFTDRLEIKEDDLSKMTDEQLREMAKTGQASA